MALLIAGSSASNLNADDFEKSFASPPASARPWVYWFPLSGNLTKEGITADFEAMARVGIGGLLYMEVDQGAPAGKADFAGPLWRELFHHACTEAKRLGLEINMNNAAGWCGSGGPWITPEFSMQKVAWTETIIEGGKRFEGALAQPQAVRDFYRDIAVLAMPLPQGDGVRLADSGVKLTCSGTATNATFTLPRPGARKREFVQFEFREPWLARALTGTVSGSSRSALHGELEMSEDGKEFTPIRSFSIYPPSLALNFKSERARFYRLVFSKCDDRNQPSIRLTDLNLGPQHRNEDFQGKASFTKGNYPAAPAAYPEAPAGVAIARDRILDLSPRMSQDGKLAWEAPSGQWLVIRFGYTTTGRENSPAPASGRGLECDKLSREAAQLHFTNLMGKLIAENRALSGKGRALVSTHIDSWEVGSQNWTPRMREEFRKRRGYDLLPFLPTFTGRVVGNAEMTERFLWDLRQTVSDLVVENYAGVFRAQANKHGLRLSIEAYDGAPCEDLAYAGQADEPMGEFWSWEKYACAYSCTEMASAAHIYGKKIVGAEAFTANSAERWLGHPASIKDLGDWAFCEGINRFVFHRYAAQPWTNCAPGMSMGPWGLHYERTQTWWEQSKPWHDYLARCQYLLRQGLFVADIAYLQPEGAPRRFTPPADAEIAPHIRGGYNFDGCTSEVVIERMRVKDGRLVLPDGMSYRILVLPDSETMTPHLLRKIKALADAGATIIGGAKPPSKSPSLVDLGAGDTEVNTLAEDFWSKGPIITSKTARQVLQERGVQPDFTATVNLRYIHRTIGQTDIYFVANPQRRQVEAVASFRVSGKQPEFWQPDTGSIGTASTFEEKAGITTVPLQFDPSGSLFVVFRKPSIGADPIDSVTRNGLALAAGPNPASHVVIQKARYGVLHDPARTRDVREKLQALVDAGTTEFKVARMAEGDDPAYMTVKTLVADYTLDSRSFTATGTDRETVSFQNRGAVSEPFAVDFARGEIWQNGSYLFKSAAGHERQLSVSLPAAQEISGPWEVSFDPNWGGPAKVTFDKLEDWSKRPEAGIKYYSGAAVYRSCFTLNQSVARNQRRYLDLGNVAVMAEVTLNGRSLGVLWKPPYRVDATSLLKAGENMLEVKVVNLWANRQVGDEQLPEDSDRNPSGTLKAWPSWVMEGKSSPTGRFAFTSWRLWRKNDALLESGLLGPVTIRTAQTVTR